MEGCQMDTLSSLNGHIQGVFMMFKLFLYNPLIQIHIQIIRPLSSFFMILCVYSYIECSTKKHEQHEQFISTTKY